MQVLTCCCRCRALASRSTSACRAATLPAAWLAAAATAADCARADSTTAYRRTGDACEGGSVMAGDSRAARWREGLLQGMGCMLARQLKLVVDDCQHSCIKWWTC